MLIEELSVGWQSSQRGMSMKLRAQETRAGDYCIESLTHHHLTTKNTLETRFQVSQFRTRGRASQLLETGFWQVCELLQLNNPINIYNFSYFNIHFKCVPLNVLMVRCFTCCLKKRKRDVSHACRPANLGQKQGYPTRPDPKKVWNKKALTFLKSPRVRLGQIFLGPTI